MNSGIYKITCLENSKFYIGKSTNFNRRFVRHRTELKNGCHKNICLQRCWNKYGAESFKFEILVICKDPYMTELEQTLLDEYFGIPSCLNLSPHAYGGSRKGIHVGQPAWNSGKPGYKIHSEEQKQKFREAMTGNKYAEGVGPNSTSFKNGATPWNKGIKWKRKVNRATI